MINRGYRFFILSSICAFYVLVYPKLVTAQSGSFRFDRISNQDGLSSNQVNTIYQDQKGYLWIGTDDGLNKFDGRDLKIYRHSINDFSSIKNSYIDAILEDDVGNLLVGTSRGISVYNLDTDDFYDFHFPGTSELLEDGNVESMLKSGNDLWISIENQGLFKLDFDLKKVDHFTMDLKNETGLVSNEIQELYSDLKGEIWIVASGILQKYVPNKNGFKRFAFSESRSSSVTTLCASDDQYLWIGTDGDGLFRVERSKLLATNSIMNSTNKHFTDIGIFEVQSIYTDNNGYVWVGEEGHGLYRFGPNDSIPPIRSSYDPSNPNSISYNSILSIYEDRIGDVWIGTVNGGLSVLHKKRQFFKHYQHLPFNENSPSANNINGFAEDENGNIWFGTNTGGLNKYDPLAGTFSVFDENNSFLVNNSVVAILKSSNGDFWFGGWKTGLYHTDSNLRLIKRFSLENSELVSNNVFALAEESDGSIWIGGIGGGLSKYSFKRNRIQSLLKQGLVPDQSPITLKVKDNLVFFGGYSGLNIYNSKTENLQEFDLGVDRLSVSSNNIQSLEIENDSILWIGTSDGLNRLNYLNSEFNYYFVEDGLPANSIKTITKGKGGDLWLGTTKGLSRFLIGEEYFINYDSYDGLQGPQFSNGSSFRTESGKYYFGGTNGFNEFSSENLDFESEQHPLLFTDFLVNNSKVTSEGDPLLSGHISEVSEIVLDSKTTEFSFSFVSLDYTFANKIGYSYKLSGYDDEWRKADGQSVSFQNIPFGEYILRLRSESPTGKTNEISVKIIILTPWWSTLLFKVLAVLISLFTIFTFYKIRTSALKRRQLKLELLVTQRTSELKNKQDEILSTNDKLNARKLELEEALSNLKHTQAQLLQSEKMASLGVFTSGIAHEINNPLQLIDGGKYLIERDIGPKSDEKLMHNFNMIDRGVQRISTIIKSLRKFSDQSKSKNTFNLHEVIDDALVLLNHEIGERITVNKKYSSDVLNFEGNMGEFHQVMLNILKNAIDGIEGKGTIDISSFSGDLGKRIEFQDSGIGIEKDKLPKVIDPFYTTKDPGKGTGMGLAIAYQIIAKHNGSLEISSDNGEGTLVTMTLP